MLRKFLLAIRLATAADCLRLLPVSILLTSAVLYILMVSQPAPHRYPAAKLAITQLSVYGIWASLLLLPAAWLLRHFRLPRKWDESGLRYSLIALHIGIYLLIVPICLYLFPSSYQQVHWITYAFLDKRWILALYWLAVGTFLFLPYLVQYCFRFLPAPAGPIPRKYKAPKAESPAGPPEPAAEGNPVLTPEVRALWRRVARWALATAAAAAFSYYFAGPPWNLERHHRGIDFHEQVHLGPLQAIDKGYLPYVGPASTQYGAGSQLATYALMKHWVQFDIAGYRNAGAAFHWLSTFITFLVIFLVLPLWSAPLAILLAETYSPLRLFYWEADGALGGFHGWANALRYMGVLVVMAGLPAAMRRRSGAIALGVAWGAFAWMSQENLSSVVAAVSLFLALLWLSNTYSGRTVVRAGVNLVIGFVAFWLPVLGYYASKGAAGEFVRCYFLVPQAVVQGFSNTLWSSATNDPQYTAFLYTPLFLIVLGICLLIHFEPFTLRSPLDYRQLRFLSFLCAVAACYSASLFRSDTSHLINTFIALPFLLTLAIADLPGWLTSRRWGQWCVRAAIAMAAVWLYPIGGDLAHPVMALLQPPLRRFQPVVEAPGATDTRAPFVRATAMLSDEPEAYSGGPAMRVLLEELSGVREIIGSRPTYIEGYPRAFVGLIYFLLDATPSPYLLEKNMMEISGPLRDEAMAYLRKHIRETKCLISPNPIAPEVLMFKEAYPDAQVFDRKILTRDYQVYVAR